MSVTIYEIIFLIFSMTSFLKNGEFDMSFLNCVRLLICSSEDNLVSTCMMNICL